jgi:hypothetical protein
MKNEEIYFIHGSKNSKDIDKLIIMNKIPTNKECIELCNSEEFDINLGVIKNEILVDVYRGTNDESNNALLVRKTNKKVTTKLHDQKYELKIKKKIKRIVPLKVSNTISSM